MDRRWRWMLPCYLMVAPLIVIALLYAVLWCRATSWKWIDGCLTFVSPRMIGNPSGQCWSPVVGFASEEDRDCDDLRVHEFCHVVQTFWFSLAGLCVVPVVCVAAGWSPAWGLLAGGPAFSLAYGGMFLGYYLTTQPDEEAGWHDDYMRNPFEKQAYAIQARFLAGELPDAWGAK